MTSEETYRPKFFWLHIKKCGGGSIRQALSPHYSIANRVRRPDNFVQTHPSLWNDILNNFRIPLGDYQFRRAEFAQRYLFSECWDTIPRFTFLRPPVARTVSSFYYLQLPRGGERSFVQQLVEEGHTVPHNHHELFELFLDLVAQSKKSDSNYKPVNLHFTTHVAPVWEDITNQSGEILLSHVYRLEALPKILKNLSIQLNLNPPVCEPDARKHARNEGLDFQPTPQQIINIESLYSRDFDLYEDALSE